MPKAKTIGENVEKTLENSIKTVLVSVSEIHKNPQNPRIIKDSAFKKLVQSVQDFPEMLQIRPIVVNAEMIILGGNMRFEACKSAGLKQVPVIIADNLTPEQEREFTIKDNVSGGEWDWELLASEWDEKELEDWGLDSLDIDNLDYSEKNKEINIDDLDSEMTIKLNFIESDYWLVKEKLSEIAATPEQAIFKLLGLDNE